MPLPHSSCMIPPAHRGSSSSLNPRRARACSRLSSLYLTLNNVSLYTDLSPPRRARARTSRCAWRKNPANARRSDTRENSYSCYILHTMSKVPCSIHSWIQVILTCSFRLYQCRKGQVDARSRIQGNKGYWHISLFCCPHNPIPV